MAANSQSTVAAILVAGGSGQRLGADRPKAFVTLAGSTLLEHTYRRFAGHPAVDIVVVVAPPTHVDHAAALTGAPTVGGGVTRQASVAAGIAALPAGVELVLVQDVARPLVPAPVIDAVLAALRAGAVGVIPVVPIHDTVRNVDPDGVLDGVVDRSRLVSVQTPQGFRLEVLSAAHAQGVGGDATDDAALVEALGHAVIAVPGADESFKITTAADLARAEHVAGLLSSHPPLTGGSP